MDEAPEIPEDLFRHDYSTGTIKCTFYHPTSGDALGVIINRRHLSGMQYAEWEAIPFGPRKGGIRSTQIGAAQLVLGPALARQWANNRIRGKARCYATRYDVLPEAVTDPTGRARLTVSTKGEWFELGEPIAVNASDCIWLMKVSSFGFHDGADVVTFTAVSEPRVFNRSDR